MNAVRPKRATRVLWALGALLLAAGAAAQTTNDYDDDNDNLIDIRTLAQLNAIRWDPDGNGSVTGSASSSYAAAFPDAATGMGCAATCAGYELRNDLDFDTNGNGYTHINGAADSRDAYYNGGAGWDPIGTKTEAYDGTHYNVRLRGNGHLIKNLFINRPSQHRMGLFAQLREYAVITALGMPNAWVVGNTDVGVVAGILRGDIGGVWTSGRVSGAYDVGGIVGTGHTPAFSQTSEIRASYSTATVNCTGAANLLSGGISTQTIGSIRTSYFAGTLTGSCYKVGIKYGPPGDRPAVATYWDTSSGGQPNSDGASRSTSALQTPTGYTGDYAVWDNQDVDFDGTTDTDPWDFGTSSQYPVLKFRGLDLHAQGRPFDYDDDNDNLIEIRTLPQLNAVRYDLNGDGVAASGATSTFIFAAAFPSPASGMGCQSTCAGYELRNDLDFDNNGSGAVDASDAFPNWAPIGGTYSATFDGNNRTISNLTIVNASGNAGLFDGVSGTVRALGVADAEVSGVGGSTTEVAPLVSELTGTVIASWASGRAGAGATGIPRVAGLVGRMSGGSALLSASYSTARVAGANNSVSFTGGLVASLNSGSEVVACYALGAVTGGGYAGGLFGGNTGPTTVRASYFAGSVAGGASTAGVTGLDDYSGETYLGVYFDAGTTGLASGTGRQTTSALQTPTSATGIYANWEDLDVNGNGTADEDPWHFGLPNQYPVLTYGGLSAAPQWDAQPDTPPAFATSTLAAMTFPGNVAIQPFQLPVVTAGNGAYAYTPSGLPAGLSMGTSTCATARTVCGTPTAATSTTVTVTVDDGDSNMAAGDRDTVTFAVTVPAAAARIVSTTPPALMETNLSGARVVVELSGTVFGASISPSGFQLATTPTIAGLSIASAIRTSATSTTLGLRFDGTNFNTRSTLAVRVLAATHRFGGDQDTGTVAVAPAMGVMLSATELALQEASGSNVGTYTVVLAGQPAAAVTVTPTSGNADVTVTGALTFDAMNWNTARTVTVTAGQDDDAVNDVAFITHAVQGIPGVASGPRVRVAVNDDDSQGLTLATSTLAAGVTEGMTGTYTARLASEPTGVVAVAISSSDGAVTVDVDAMADGEQATLLFNATNWDTPQTVTVAAGEDDDGENETVTLTHNPSGADYGAVTSVDVSFTATDNDTRGATVSVGAGPLAVQENGTETYTLVLDTEPVNGNVSVAVASSATAVATVEPATLTFTARNWNVPQTVTVAGVDDAGTSNSAATVTHTPTGADYGSVTIGSFSVVVVDDEAAGLKVSPTSLTVAEGATATYTVRLNTAPTGAVTVTVGGATAKVAADTDTQMTGDQTTLSFDATNWNTAQTVTVTAVADDDGADETATLTNTASGAGAYNSLTSTPGVAVQVRDDETAGVVVSPMSLAIDEGGTATYTVRLSAPPASGTSTVAVAATGMAGLTVATSSLVFNATTTLLFTGTTWNTAQTVTVTAVADHDRLTDGAAALTHAVTNYGAVMAGPDVRVTVRNTTVDHDADADGLIEIDSLAKLDAVRWDLDGDGTPAAGATSTAAHAAAFPNPRGGGACPTSVSGVACRGYELTTDLDFDTDGDGRTWTETGGVVSGDDGDDHYNGGLGWTPIGDGSDYGAIFRGNGHVVRNLFVNLNRGANRYAGLFDGLAGAGRIESLGVLDGYVRESHGAGLLVGWSNGEVAGCYSTGRVVATSAIAGAAGGLIGVFGTFGGFSGSIAASYSTARATSPFHAGGLVGRVVNGGTATIDSSWAAGPVSGTSSGGGLVGLVVTNTAATTASYYDNVATGQMTSARGVGQSTADLQRPTGYTGIYATWNVDLDGDGGPDDPWNFGTSSQYPSLKWGGFDVTEQFVSALAFASGVSGKSFAVGRSITPFRVPAAAGGQGTVRYSARGLPPGLWFDADGRGQCGLARSVCGTPSEAGSWTATVTARDGAGATAALTFQVEVVADGDVDVDAGPPAVVPDAALREAVARALGVEASSLTEGHLLALSSLSASWSGVTSLAGLSAASNLRRLELGGNAVADLSELSGLRLLEHLDLSDNAVSDLSELSGLTRLETLLLSGNRVSDLSPLRGMAGLRSLFLDGNAVSDLTPVVFLESLEELSLSGNPLAGLSPLCALRGLKRLWLAASGLSDLSELSCLTGLERLWLADNAVEDVGPLRGMRALEWLDLERNAVAGVAPLRRLNALTRLRLGSNRVSDAGPLAANDGLAAGDVAGLRGNPLSEASIQRHVPALRERGVAVLAGLPAPWFAASADASGRRSFMRLINRSEVAGEALVWGVDDAGERFGPARLSIGAGRTAHFNSEDLEFGNAAKGLADGLGAPTAGGWRLEVLSTLDLEAQTFLRASGGPPSALHDGLPRVGGTLRAAFLPAGRERSPAGALRVSNPTGSDATAYAWGVDEAGVGRLATGLVAPAGRAVTVSASELERWRMDSGRGLGRGAGNWRLELTAPWPLEAQALAVGDGGRTGNLSGPAAALGPGVVARVPLFPPASAAGRVGVARVWNLGAAAGEVLVTAVDDAGVSAGPVALALEAFAAAEFDSRELEEGGGPLAEGVGAPTRGSWRLELRAQFGARVHARAVGAGGYATGLLEAAPRSGGVARVSMFNPGSNRAQRSLLRLANDGAEDAAATIGGVDDAGRAGGAVSVTVPAGEALWLSAAELESGGAGFAGSLGDGAGKWRLTVSSDAPLTVMSLVEDEQGALGNLSTPGRR